MLNCCEGDVLFLLDSSGSVSAYEFSGMLDFLAALLQPFSLGPDQVRVGLLQVGTQPHLEFGFDAYRSQDALQKALQRTKQLRGDTNTEGALELARDWVLRPGIQGGARPDLPRVIVWLTDGVEPGAVQRPMADLREEGVAVLVVSTGHSNYRVLRDVVSPPIEDHLYFVDIDDINIITEDLRNAIIEIIRAERLQIRDVSTHSAMLHWRPVLADSGHYDIRFGPVPSGNVGDGSRPGTSPGTGLGSYQRITRPAESSSAMLTGLRPDTKYTVTLTPQSNDDILKPLTTFFSTQPEVLSPVVVTVSEARSDSVKVSWGPLQPESVEKYQVEYSALPAGQVQVATVGTQHNSTVIRQLRPDTQYLVTVSARHVSGRERAMSVRVCTQEETPALSHLELTTVGSDSVEVQWKGGVEGVRGYWVTWGTDHALKSSSIYLPPSSVSTVLTHVPPGTRVCVSPVYRTTRGGGLCCTARLTSEALTWNQRL
uniref:von Willebrand factor A domain-containing protein 1 n=1 Tax=Denticeps clupeoides TaxID=299321 RepID=A0AAY4EGC9_9TELE